MRFLPFVFAGIWVCGLLTRTALPIANQRPESAEDMEVFETQAASSLTGEFRSSLATYLWAKTDEYIHGGVLLRPMTSNEKSRGVERATSGDKTIVHTGDETGVVPAQDNDPRGFWGDLERETKPYFDVGGHKHRNPAECLPLYRFMTWSEPSFVPGYVVGAAVITQSRNAKEAIAFLQEGIRYNPKNPQLYTESARYRLTKTKEYDLAEQELMSAIRLANGVKSDSLNDSYRWLVLLYRVQGKTAEERRIAAEGLRLFPEDPVCRHSLGRL